MFEQYAGILAQRYGPQLNINGDHFPPPTWRMQLAHLLGALKMALVVAVFAGFDPFASLLGRAAPQWWTWLLGNKLYACLMIFFVGNAIEGQLVSTGAFEISLDAMPVWSKIDSGRIPQPPELFQIIDNHFKMNVGDAGNGNGIGDFHDEL